MNDAEKRKFVKNMVRSEKGRNEMVYYNQAFILQINKKL